MTAAKSSEKDAVWGDLSAHAATEAHTLNQARGSLAFTTGRDILFDQREYILETAKAQNPLANELTQIVQHVGANGMASPRVQRLCPECEEGTGGLRVPTKLTVRPADDIHEQKADRVTQSVTR